jgi:hypothetical protein
MIARLAGQYVTDILANIASGTVLIGLRNAFEAPFGGAFSFLTFRGPVKRKHQDRRAQKKARD